MSDPVSPGEAGGIAALVVMVLGTIGGGVRWLLGWRDRREGTRTAKLDAWQRELNDKAALIAAAEEEYQKKIEVRLSQVELESRALRLAFGVVSDALRVIDPGNNALERAQAILDRAFPVALDLPHGMIDDLNRIDAAVPRANAQRPRSTQRKPRG